MGSIPNQVSGRYEIERFELPGQINLVWVFQVPLEPSNQLIIHKVCIHAENMMKLRGLNQFPLI